MKLSSTRAVSGALCVALSLLVLPLVERERPRYPALEEHEGEEDVRPDKPEQALAFRSLSLRDDAGIIAPGGLMRAKKHVDAMKAAKAARAARMPKAQRSTDADAPSAATATGTQDTSGELSTMSAPLTRTGWTSIGPGNIGGRVRTVLVHPTKPGTMFAGSVGGGIWKTVNGGASWTPMSDFMANLAVTSMVFNPTNPSIMYAATGEGYNNADAIRGAGIFKSTDGGATWTQLPSTATAMFHYVLRLAISPDGRVLLAGTTTGLFRSTDGGTTFAKVTGPIAADIDFHPSDSRRAIAGDRSGGVWHTADGGLTWTATSLPVAASMPGSRRVEVAYARNTPDVVYAVVDGGGGMVFRSVNGGISFSCMFTSDAFELLENGQGWYDLALWVNPRDPNDVIVGGVNLFRSRDGGTTFTQVSYPQGSFHADQHVIIEHPQFDNAGNRVLFIGNDGGVYRVPDVALLTSAAAAQFEGLNNNLAVTQFYGAGGNPATGVIVGGTQDNGTLVYDPWAGSEGWAPMFGGDGGFSAADPADSNFFYGEYVYLQLHRSTNGGASSRFIYSGIQDAGYAANFIAPFVLDPNEPQRMWAGGQSLWRTDNVKAAVPSWRAVKPPSASYISAVAVAPGNSNIVWVGHNNGDLYRSLNATAAAPSWAKVDPTSFPNRFVTRITVDAFNANMVYVAFGGFVDGNIQRTDDSGGTWVDATGTGSTGLPFAPVRDVEVDPTDSSVIWAATEVGIFTSRDRGQTWDVTQDGPANVSVDELFVLGDSLYAVTHGRGLFRHPLNDTVEPPPPAAELPAPWSTRDIGNVGVAGDAAYVSGTFTIAGAGADVWGAADAFRFVYQPLAADGDIVARVASVENVASWVKAGVMVRQGLDPGSAHAFMIVSAAKGLAFQRRTQAGGATTSTLTAGAAPAWVKLARRGTRVTASTSPDGTSWTVVGQDTIALSGSVYVGLAVSAHTTTRTATAVFDRVSVTSVAASRLPTGWQSRDIGVVGVAGSALESGGTFTLKGAGADVWGTSDAFHYAYRTLSGDGAIVARVASVAGTQAWTKVGVMMRSTTSASSAHALMLVSTAKGIAFQRRTADGGLSTNTSGGAGTAPRWVKLARTGSTITASVSSDGVNWSLVGKDTFPTMPASILVGLVAHSHDTTVLATAAFDHVSVGAGTLPAGWTARDVGTTGVAGRATYDGTAFRVKGGGADVWGTGDALHYLYRTMAGDGDVVARVSSVEYVHAWTKAGLMIRAGTGAGAAHASIFVTPGKGTAFQRRTSDRGESLHTAGDAGSAPRFVKLTRRGQTIAASVSTNGTTWTTIGSDTFAMPSTVLVGLAVSSHDPTRLAAVTFDGVKVP